MLKGQRVKVECKIARGNRLYADEIEFVSVEDDDFEIEGRIRKLNRAQKTFYIHRFPFTVYERTEIHGESKAHLRSFEDLRNGLRVKVEAKRRKDGFIKAKEIRIYEGSDDNDIEIEAVVEAVSVPRSEFTLVEAPILVTPKTDFQNMQGISTGTFSDARTSSLIRRDDDEPLIAPIRFGNVYIGGKAGYRLDLTRDRDLDENEPDAVNRFAPELQVEVSAPLTEFIEAYGRFNFIQGRFPGSSPAIETKSEVEVREAYVYVGNLFHRSLGLQIGRQRFRDKREWLYDDRLDAVRLHYIRNNWTTEAAAAKTLFNPTGSRSDQLYLILRSEYKFPGRRYLAGYLMKRNDTSGRDEDPIWYGLSSRGRINRKLQYWGELSRAAGRREDRLIRGWAFDAGGGYRLP